MARKVGVIGLGIMGGAMARNLCEAGFKVIGFDPSAGAAERAAAAGVTIAASVAEVASDARDIITSLPSPAALRSTAAEIARATTEQRIVIETSTMALDDKLAFAGVLQAAGHVALDCPLSGTGAQARTRDLVVLASGDSAAIKKVDAVFKGFSRLVYDLGVFGNGSKMKFVANHLVAVNNVATAEAMVLGMKAGLDPHQIVEVIGAGAGTSKVFELRAPLMANNRYQPATMKCDIWQKDMSVISKFAASIGAPTPVFDATKPVYDAGIAQGHGDDDTAAVCAVLEKLAGVTR